MSVIRSHFMCGRKRRSTSPCLTPAIHEGNLVIGQLLAIRGNTGIVTAETAQGLLMFDIKLAGGAWFTEREGQICLDQTLPFPRVDVKEGDIVCFEQPLDPIDRVLRWGFGANLATLLVGGRVSSDWKELDMLTDEAREFAPLLVDEEGKITPEGPSEAWNDILTGRMHWTAARAAA